MTNFRLAWRMGTDHAVLVSLRGVGVSDICFGHTLAVLPSLPSGPLRTGFNLVPEQ